VSFLSFVGIPPLAGFAAKLTLFGAVIEAGYGWLALLAVINTVVSLAYYARVLGPAYFEPAPGTPAPEPLPLLGSWAGVAVAICAAGLVVLGVGADALLEALRAARLLPGY
jgi:NADH-quinone oxidoreductase subunit N